MERWAKKVNVNKDVARPQAAQSTQEASKESTYQYDPNELKKVSKFQLKIKWHDLQSKGILPAKQSEWIICSPKSILNTVLVL